MTDWDLWLACDICPAMQGQACYVRSSGGPEALPEIRMSVPHSCRKPSAKAALPSRKPTPQSSPRAPANPGRRRVARTASTVSSWQVLADRQRRRG